MFTRLFALFFLLCPSCLKGIIVESPKFAEIGKHLVKCRPDKAVIVCDIDNTLLMSTQHIGSVAWADHTIAELVKKGVAKEDAEEIQNILWRAVQPSVNVQNVDPEAPSILKGLHDAGFLILGLTARTPKEGDYTLRQLKSIGINLGKSKPEFSFDSFGKEKRETLYREGILFGTPFNKKSDVLFKFLDENRIDPVHIIFIDDKLSHLEDLSLACAERNISFSGIRFSGADQHVKSFSRQIADLQWSLFPALISDSQAEEILMGAKN